MGQDCKELGWMAGYSKLSAVLPMACPPTKQGMLAIPDKGLNHVQHP
jgi:hypothetical protein